MRTQRPLAGVLAATILACGAAPAVGSRVFDNDGGRTYTGVARRATLRTELVTLTCDLTIAGIMMLETGTIQKDRRGNAGEIRTASATNCTNNLGVGPTAIRVLVEALRPWQIKYVSFRGTLPAITEILFKLETFRALVQVEGTSCLYASGVNGVPLGTTGRAEERAYEIKRAAPLANSIPLQAVLREEFFRPCPASFEMAAGFIAPEGRPADFSIRVILRP